ncbi:hypothetical protein OC842_007439 [Tilletia horrida]|uniref:Aminotransferase class I/classII large domain-containing protein n=1 Tax=Tilletia horrida TaxID=155126 RepID=A0AAN6G6P6_9BASI|nr:hypothetical protein OC842_007439 [Tilletia horrida]
MLADQMREALERRRQRAMLRALTVRGTTARSATAASSSSSSSSSGKDDRRTEPEQRNASMATTAAPLTDFSSNDYLSLASSAEMRAAFVQRVLQAQTNPLGSTGSRLLDGNSVEHEELERRLASFFQAPSALFFGSGYEANVSLFSTLPQPGDLVLYDELIHASVHDGMRQSRVTSERRLAFVHNDLSDLERLLRAWCTVDSGSDSAAEAQDRNQFAHALRQRRVNVFIAVEAVYSMDGDLCPLAVLVSLAQRLVPRECLHIIVDEAHSTGTYGPQGRGLCAELGLTGSKPMEEGVRVRLATFGKACGASGGVVLCDPLLRQYLINYARPFIFSTAPPQAVLMAAHSSIDMLERDEVGGRRRAEMVRRTRMLIDGLRGVVQYAAERGVRTARQRSAPLLALVSALSTAGSNTQEGDGAAILRADQNDDEQDRFAPSPIVPLLTPTPRPLSARLQARGFLVRPITYPTVPLGQDRVRICVHAGNSEAEVHGLCAAVREWVDDVLRAEEERQEGHGLVPTPMEDGKQMGRGRSCGRSTEGAHLPAPGLPSLPSLKPRL